MSCDILKKPLVQNHPPTGGSALPVAFACSGPTHIIAVTSDRSHVTKMGEKVERVNERISGEGYNSSSEAE
jgi:hypothetical protein